MSRWKEASLASAGRDWAQPASPAGLMAKGAPKGHSRTVIGCAKQILEGLEGAAKNEGESRT